MKARKGEKLRPCVRCETPVRYLRGSWTAYGEKSIAACDTKKKMDHDGPCFRHGWHWVNQNGTHHRCGDFMEVGVVNQDVLAAQFKDALERDSYRTEQGAER